MSNRDSNRSEYRYFPEDEPSLTLLLDAFLRTLRDDLTTRPIVRKVCALMFAGGYGRGEGGIYRDSEGNALHLYNNLEFYLIVVDKAAILPAEMWCRQQSARGERELGIAVDFKVLAESALRKAQPSMFIYDLLMAHRLVYGSENFVQTLPPILRDPSVITRHRQHAYYSTGEAACSFHFPHYVPLPELARAIARLK